MNIGPQRPEALLGQVIAGYELVEYIGTGATGLVFRGRLTDAPIVEKTNFKPPLLPDEAAIKLLVPPIGSTQKELDEFHSRFRLEARVLSELEYSSILRVLAYGDDAASGMSYMILPFMAGGSLASVIAERGPLPLPEVARILTPIAAALDYAHRHNVVHRDVKPGNILLDATGAPALSDFSIVRLLSEGGSMRTTTGRMMGTPAYMSPEQFDDSSKVGPAADIYGLGMVAYEMVTGRAAFASTSWAQAMRQQLQAAPPEPRTLRPDLPEPAQAAILRALEKDPARRFPTATAFAEAFALGAQGTWAPGLTRFAASLPPVGLEQTAPNMRTIPAGREPRRRSGVPLLVGGLAVALIIACIAALAFGAGTSLLAKFLPGTPTGSPLVYATATQTATPAGKGTPGSPTATPKKGDPSKPGTPTATLKPGVPTYTPVPGVSPTSAAAPSPTSTPSFPNLIVSTDASQSSDGQSHGSGNPYVFTGNRQYNDVTIQSGAWATAAGYCAGQGNGIVQFTASGTVTIAGTLEVDAEGYCGGKSTQGANGGWQGNSYTGSSQQQALANNGGGGGGDTADSGGGGGGYGTAGTSSYLNASSYDTSVIGGQPYGSTSLSTLYLGSGGGSSGAQSGCVDAVGGVGGGAVSITANTIIVTGRISAKGGNGASVPNTTNNYRGGGGGSGGSIYLRATVVSIGVNLVTATGGSGGYGIWDNTRIISGGDGGVGRIHIVAQSLSGSTNPAAQ